MWVLKAAEELIVMVRGSHRFGLQEDEKEFFKGTCCPSIKQTLPLRW